MRANQRVSPPRRSQLTGSTVCYAGNARSIENIIICPSIESLEGLENVQEIAAVEGIDAADPRDRVGGRLRGIMTRSRGEGGGSGSGRFEPFSRGQSLDW